MAKLNSYLFDLAEPLTRAYSEEQVVLIKEDIPQGNKFLSALVDRLEAELASKSKEIASSVNYSKENWAYLVADNFGYCRGLQRALSLINARLLTEEETNG